WLSCNTQLAHLGLVLPTEAQWERACRAGTSTVYSSGTDPETLKEVGNISDAYAKAHGASGDWGSFAPWDDGNTCIAEVGSYRPNAYGLHDMHGNVSEWCRERWDGIADYTNLTLDSEARRGVPGGSVPKESEDKCVNRGGFFAGDPAAARSAARA